jgi:Na+/H+ antiporter NhaC
VPQGFTLSTTGVFAILLEHRPHPGPVTIWLFIAGAALGFSIIVRASGAHRSDSTLQPASGYQLFNLTPIAVVPAVSLIVWWIPLGPVAYAFGGLSASSGYLLAVASLFHAIRKVPR